MSKIKIDVVLMENGNEQINRSYSGILQDNIIKYSDGIINIYDIEKKVLRRKTEEYELILDFCNDAALYHFNNLELSLNLKTYSVVSLNNKICVKYSLEENKFEYIINWRKV